MALKPALFLHGFTGSGASWSEVAAGLSDCLAASCPDLPGHAGAPLPARLGREGFDATIELLATKISVPTMVIGYSQGARLALALALRHPNKVTRLILESGTAGLVRHRDRALRQAEDEGHASMLESQGLEAFICRWERLPLFSAAAPNEELNRRRRSHSSSGLAGALRCLGLGIQPNFWPLLPRLRVPTLLITGSNDAKFTALARKMVAELPQGWQVKVPKAGHAVHREAPREWVGEVGAFANATFSHEYQHEEISR